MTRCDVHLREVLMTRRRLHLWAVAWLHLRAVAWLRSSLLGSIASHGTMTNTSSPVLGQWLSGHWRIPVRRHPYGFIQECCRRRGSRAWRKRCLLRENELSVSIQALHGNVD